MKIERICVLGGTGLVGSHLVGRLATAGRHILVASRRPERHRDLRVLPGVRLEQADVHDPGNLARLLEGQQAVVNLIGILNERGRKGQGFRRVHVDLPRQLIQACQRAGVGRLLHMSALHADQATGSSHYLRSKGEGENLLHTFRGATAVTSFRPSVIFGPGDGFVNRFAGLLALAPGVLPLGCPDARFAPVYVGDVVDAFARALEDRQSFGRRYDLCGPREYRLIELVRYVAQESGRRRWVIGLPDWASRLQAAALELFPGKPFSMDNYRSLQVDSVCEAATPRCPTALETVVPRYLGAARRPSRYDAFRRLAGRD